MHSVTKRDIIRYAVLPGFRQRFSDLFASGFQYVPYFMALVYRAVRLLPENHPYLLPSNMGRFGVRHVIAEAANNIVFSRNNIDQILLFATILMGIALVILQLLLLGISIFFQPAIAAMPTSFAGFFLTPAPEQDLAHIMLDMVFGVPGLFDSCVFTAAACTNISGNAIQSTVAGVNWALEPAAAGTPTPMNQGLHQLFRLYNTGLMVVGVLISIYFIMTILAETAQSGTPFGRRFNKVWAPVRFVVAFGLLVPVTFGYNSSQYIVLYAAKFGSGFATNGWNLFGDTLSATFAGGLRNMLNTADGPGGTIAQPNVPEISNLLQFMYSAKACQNAVALSNGLVGDPDTTGSAANSEHVKMYVVIDPLAAPANYQHVQNVASVTYDQLWNFTNNGVAGGSFVDTAIIRFGQRNPDDYALQRGFVNPTCGEIHLKFSDPRDPTCAGPNCSEVGVEAMQRYYWFIIKELWFETLEGASTYPPLVAPNYARNLARSTVRFTNQPAGANHNTTLPLPNADWRMDLNDFYRRDLRNAMTNPGATGLTGIIGTGAGGAIEAMETSGRWNVDAVVRAKGWVGASVWYNRISEMNGAMTGSVLNIPYPNRYPEVMEKVYQEKLQREKNVDPKTRFDPQSSNAAANKNLSETEKKIASVLWKAFDYWQDGSGTASSHTAPTGNVIVDIINLFFGTEGLFDMRRNDGVHPLAKLTAVGRGLIEASVRNLGYTGALAIASLFDSPIEAGAKMAGSFLLTFAMITLTAGFILFYIVPFLPFIYFFFAFGGWIKGIFEAMVGAPLWALAHLRIDGPGLAGQAAVSGYFLIFEVFLRPILIIFGLLASVSIFSALVSVLNQTFDLVVQNTGGFDIVAELGGIGAPQIAVMRSAIDQFFFTIIYTIIVYLMGMSSFKLVDLIPNNILRWMNQSVATFGDQREDSGQSLVGTSTLGSQQTLSQLGQGAQGFFK